jgi:hypothetical protein
MSKSDAQQDILCHQHHFIRVPCWCVCLSLAHSSLPGYHVRLQNLALETNFMQTACGRPSCCSSWSWKPMRSTATPAAYAEQHDRRPCRVYRQQPVGPDLPTQRTSALPAPPPATPSRSQATSPAPRTPATSRSGCDRQQVVDRCRPHFTGVDDIIGVGLVDLGVGRGRDPDVHGQPRTLRRSPRVTLR